MGTAQEVTETSAVVEKVLNVPVFMYSYPTTEFTEIETHTATWSAIASGLGEDMSVDDKVKEIINKAKNKQKKGDVKDFDAIIINPDDYPGILIKFTNQVDLKSQVKKVSNVPIFMFSYPEKPFDEVGTLEATFSALLGESKLSERTKEIVNKAKKRLEKGKVKPFDAIIISPDDFTGILIKFK
jgi:hypothetical protein